MSAVSPLVMDWTKNKLSWRYIYAPKVVPRVLVAREMYQLAEHKYPEGTLINIAAVFDSPLCGLRMQAAPSLDTERTHVVATLTIGWTTPNVLEFALIPPMTPPGLFILQVCKEWPWLNFCRLYVFNNDTNPHTCIGTGYTIAVLEEPRPTPSPEIEAAILASQQETVNILKKGGTV